MKSTGVVRQLDALGRIVLPIELRRTMNIDTKDGLEIYVNGDEIVLKKHDAHCVFCAGLNEVTNYRGKLICKSCLNELKAIDL